MNTEYFLVLLGFICFFAVLTASVFAMNFFINNPKDNFMNEFCLEQGFEKHEWIKNQKNVCVKIIGNTKQVKQIDCDTTQDFFEYITHPFEKCYFIEAK